MFIDESGTMCSALLPREVEKFSMSEDDVMFVQLLKLWTQRDVHSQTAAGSEKSQSINKH